MDWEYLCRRSGCGEMAFMDWWMIDWKAILRDQERKGKAKQPGLHVKRAYLLAELTGWYSQRRKPYGLVSSC
jgi:hypothetical protein